MIVAVTGIRELAPGSDPAVEKAIREFKGVTEWRFGGARGADTIALLAAFNSHRAIPRRVYVPCTLADQPSQVRAVTRRCATAIIELGFPSLPASYLRRNDAMLEGAGHCLAFTDERTTGGTHYTIGKARKSRIPVTIVLVEATGS